MKRFYLALIVLVIGHTGCVRNKKKHHETLAREYFKLALLELSEERLEALHYKKALGLIDQAYEHDQKPHYLAMKATLLFTLKYFDESLAVYEQALKSCADETTKAEIYNNYACLLAQQGHTQKAIDLLNMVIESRYYLTPEVALVNLGRLFYDKGDLDKAQDYFQKAITIAPSYVDAHYFLSLVADHNNDSLLAKKECSTTKFLTSALCDNACVL